MNYKEKIELLENAFNKKVKKKNKISKKGKKTKKIEDELLIETLNELMK